MNAIRTLTLIALMSASAVALAAEYTPGMRWECTRKGAPSHTEIATAFGFNNYALARQAQPRLYTELRRACSRGSAPVLLVRSNGGKVEVRAIAAH